jgi:hypothetical protein
MHSLTCRTSIKDPALEADFLEVPALNEQTDTHSLADMIYSLLTGKAVLVALSLLWFCRFVR